MYGKIILNIFFSIFLVAMQLSFVSGLPSVFSNVNLVLVSLIFILAVGDLKFSIWWVAGTGLLMDVFLSAVRHLFIESGRDRVIYRFVPEKAFH